MIQMRYHYVKMKLITRDTDYAVRALCYMAEKEDGKASAAELVSEIRIPRPFLRKILQALNREGILRSSKGKGGGFELARQPNEISVNDVINVFQGKMSLNECTFKKKKCPNTKNCALRRKIDVIENFALEQFKKLNIQTLTGE